MAETDRIVVLPSRLHDADEPGVGHLTGSGFEHPTLPIAELARTHIVDTLLQSLAGQ